MDAGGWRQRKRKPGDDSQSAQAEAPVLDSQSGETKRGKTFKRKEPPSRRGEGSAGVSLGAGAGSASGGGAASSTALASEKASSAKRRKGADQPVERKHKRDCSEYWAQIDAFLSNKVACTTLQHCSTHSAHSSAADVAGSSPEHVGHDEDADTDAARAELAAFLAQPIGFDGCDSALTFADVTGRGQLAVFVERQQVAAVSGLVLAGLKFYVNWVRFPLPSEAWIVRPSIDDTVYEFGNACDSCCAKIQARADAASAAGPKFFAEAAGVLLNCHGLSKGPVGIVLAYSCAVKLATELCGPDSCL